MTREEAIKCLTSFVEIRRKYCDMQTMKDEIECLEMAIKALEQEPKIVNLGDNVVYGTDGNLYKITVSSGKALEQEPCEDAIGRSDMLDVIGHGTTYSSEELQKIIKGLPPVTPQPKTGHWILTSDDDYEYCTCSECGYQNGENWMIGSQIKYCPNCGAKMIDVHDTNIGKMTEIPTGSEGSNKVNCDKTECYNCVNHGYCDYEPQESEEIDADSD